MTLDEWVAATAQTLGVDPIDGDGQRTVLEVAREVAHNVLRPGAPVSTFLVGLAVGRGMPLDEAAAMVIELTRRSSPTDPQASAGSGFPG